MSDIELPGQVSPSNPPAGSNQSTQRLPQPASRSNTNRTTTSSINRGGRNINRHSMNVEAYIRQLAVTQRLEQQQHHQSVNHGLYGGTGNSSLAGSAHSSQYISHPKKASSSSLARPPRSQMVRSATPANQPVHQPLLEDVSPVESPLNSPPAATDSGPTSPVAMMPSPRPPFSTTYPVTTDDFLAIVEEVREAIKTGIQPLRIAQGSSGSYFCRNRAGEIVGVFKPKDEEPYGHLNPKWTKWLHRTCCPCMFGRSCLIPNLGYVSEAAASVVDRHLGLNIVPRTDIITLSSPAFAYSKADRRKARQTGKELRAKLGSFQLFMHGYTNASVFIRDGPRWIHEGRISADVSGRYLHPQLQHQFQQEFEKLVIIDFIIRNTDRSLDNWMVRVGDPSECMTPIPASHTPLPGAIPESPKSDSSKSQPLHNSANDYLLIQSPPKLSIAAIDNGLAFPFKHPDAVRSYPYYWANLPTARVPFSHGIRKALLPLLTSSSWWKDLQTDLKHVFQLDKDFDEMLFRRQVAVVKGQVFHLVQILSSGASALTECLQGCPLDLIQQPPCLVWENEDVRDLAAGSLGVDIVREGLLGTVIGGLDTQPNSTRASTAATMSHPVGGMGGSHAHVAPIVTINTGLKPGTAVGGSKAPSALALTRSETAGQQQSNNKTEGPTPTPNNNGQSKNGSQNLPSQSSPLSKPEISFQQQPNKSDSHQNRRNSEQQPSQQNPSQPSVPSTPGSPARLLGNNLRSTISLASLPHKSQRTFVPLSSSSTGYFLVDPAKHQQGPLQVSFPESSTRHRTASNRRLEQIRQKWSAVGHELGMYKGRVITFVKQQPWFSNW